ncbi:MAG: PAS domain-containing protein, partial [Candidatus Woesearchaeota archaeon]
MDKSDTLYYHFASLEKLFNDEFYNHPQLAQVLVLLNEIKHKSAALEVKNRALCDEINFLWNTAYEPMAITNYQQQILKVNTAYSKLVNKSPAQLLGENIFTMYDNPLQSSHAQAFDALTKSPQLITKNKTKATLWNGKQLYLESTLLKYTYNDKKNVLHILRDVTESEVHQEEQYLFMKALLHDTRNLLHGLQAYHQLLYDDLTPLLLPANFQEEKQKTIMQTKQQEWYQEFPLLNTYLKTTGNLIHSLTFIVQTYSKMLAVETGAIFPTPTSLYPSDCIKNLTKVLEPQLTKKKLVLKNLIPEHCCAYADPNFITPIFYNYFVNAIKFSNKGTNIEVGVQPY